MIALNTDSEISPIPPLIWHGCQKIFGTWGSRNKATYRYQTSKTNLGSVMMVLRLRYCPVHSTPKTRRQIEISHIFDLYSEKHLKTSRGRQSIALFQEIGVAKSNVNVRILTGSSQIAVSVHAQYKFDKKTAQNDWRDVGRPSSCNASQLPTFLVFKELMAITTMTMITMVMMMMMMMTMTICGNALHAETPGENSSTPSICKLNKSIYHSCLFHPVAGFCIRRSARHVRRRKHNGSH